MAADADVVALSPGAALARPLSGLERVWLAADGLCAPFVNQCVIEGSGAIDPGALSAAVASAAAHNPGARMLLRGALGWSRWRVAQDAPTVQEVDGAGWDGMGDAGAPFLLRRLDPWRGPACEVLVVRGAPLRVVVRTHHALMDGRGTRLFAEEIFRALRGERALGSLGGGPTDAELAASAWRGGALPRDPPARFLAPLPAAPASRDAPTEGQPWMWRRLTVQVSGRRVLARAVAAVAALAGGPCRIGVPVDLRKHCPTLRSTANLTGILHVELDGAAASPDGADRAIQAALDGQDAEGHALAARGLRWVPLGLMVHVGRRAAAAQLHAGRFVASATVSNLGRAPLAELSAPGFEARSVLWIPPPSLGLPLFLSLSGHENGVDLCATAPVALGAGGRLEAALAAVAAALSDPARAGAG